MVRLPGLKSRLGRLIWPRGVLFAALLLLLALGAYKGRRVWGLLGSLQERLDELQAAADGSSDVGLGALGASLRGAEADLDALRGEVGIFLPLTRHLGWVPGVGGDLRAAPVLLDVAQSVTQAGSVAFDGLEPLVALTEGDQVVDRPLAQVLTTLSDARPDLEAAQARLAVALGRRLEVDDSALSPRTASLVERLDRYLPLMQTGLDGARLLPDLLGASGQRSYLLLVQNNDEARATGGFISAVGLLLLQDGDIAEISFEDSYAVDDFTRPYPDSPPPVLRYMGIDQWVFRDANWSPDFPTSAQKALELYRGRHDLQVDGVMAVDQHALRAVVAALAPLEVPGWPEPVTGENVISLIRLAWSPAESEQGSGFDIEWWRQRKAFINDLMTAMRARLETSPGDVNWVALARALLETLDQRHLQVWLADTANPARDLLAERGWDGALRQTSSDYVLVVDTNMGFNKVNASVRQSLDYRVLISVDGTAQATLTVRHVNPGDEAVACDPQPHYTTNVTYEDLTSHCYWNYMRVYVPAGSQLFAATAHPVSADTLITHQRQPGTAEILPGEHGRAVFGSFFVLPRGEETETRFVYQLPPTTLERRDDGWVYRLLVQKQAGTDAVPLQVALALPPGSMVQSVSPSPEAGPGEEGHPLDSDTVRFDVTLDEDRVFEVWFQLDGEGEQ